MRKSQRYFRVSVTVTHELMETLFDLLKNEDAHDFRMMELGPDGQVPKQTMTASPPIVNPIGRQPRDKSRSQGWVMKHWPIVQPVFKQLNGGSINYKDMRLIQAIVESGMSPSSVTTILSAFVMHGLVKRVGHGEYALP